jgi:hypothetical protein
MAMVKAETCFRSLCFGTVVAGMMMLVSSVLWVTVGGASTTESAPALLEKRDRGTAKLPAGLDAMDVVRMIQKNRERLVGRNTVVEEGLDSSGVLRGGAHGERDHFGLAPVPVDGGYHGSSFARARVRGALPLSVDGESRPAGQPAPASELGPAFQIGGDPIYGPAACSQYCPAIAFDGTNYLVVWYDYRGGSSTDIYGARVSAGGSVLDPAGIAICTAANDQFNPAIASDGANYLVVWEDYRGGSSTDIYGARVSAGGSVLDPAGIAISTASSYQYSPAVAFDGTNYLVVWNDYRYVSYNPDIYGARVSKGGSVLDPTGIAVSTAANPQEYPAIASDGINYLVVWGDHRSGSSWDIYGTRVSASGSVLDPWGIAISTGWGDHYDPAIAFDGTNYLVVWDESWSGSYDVYGARVSVSGSVLDPWGIGISAAAEYPAIAFDGINYLVVWQDPRSGSSWDIYGARVSAGGAVLDPGGIAISTATNDQEVPAIAFDGTHYLVVWEDSRSGSRDIYGARVSVGGSVLDTAGIPISTAANRQNYPAIAFDGRNCLVVWQDSCSGSRDIYGARVSVGGSVLDTAGIAISTAAGNQEYPAVGFDGTDYVVVWMDKRNGSSYDVYGARVDPTGTVHDPTGTPISVEAYDQLYPTLARGGPYGTLIVYQSLTPPPVYGYYRIWGNMWGEIVGVDEKQAQLVFNAHQSYPNPFNPMCTIPYDLPHAGRVSLQVFDVTGSVVRTLVDAWREPGVYSEVWDGMGEDGIALPSGVYFYRLEAGDFVATRKMVLLH